MGGQRGRDHLERLTTRPDAAHGVQHQRSLRDRPRIAARLDRAARVDHQDRRPRGRKVLTDRDRSRVHVPFTRRIRPIPNLDTASRNPIHFRAAHFEVTRVRTDRDWDGRPRRIRRSKVDYAVTRINRPQNIRPTTKIGRIDGDVRIGPSIGAQGRARIRHGEGARAVGVTVRVEVQQTGRPGAGVRSDIRVRARQANASSRVQLDLAARGLDVIAAAQVTHCQVILVRHRQRDLRGGTRHDGAVDTQIAVTIRRAQHHGNGVRRLDPVEGRDLVDAQPISGGDFRDPHHAVVRVGRGRRDVRLDRIRYANRGCGVKSDRAVIHADRRITHADQATAVRAVNGRTALNKHQTGTGRGGHRALDIDQTGVATPDHQAPARSHRADLSTLQLERIRTARSRAQHDDLARRVRPQNDVRHSRASRDRSGRQDHLVRGQRHRAGAAVVADGARVRQRRVIPTQGDLDGRAPGRARIRSDAGPAADRCIPFINRERNGAGVRIDRAEGERAGPVRRCEDDVSVVLGIHGSHRDIRVIRVQQVNPDLPERRMVARCRSQGIHIHIETARGTGTESGRRRERQRPGMDIDRIVVGSATVQNRAGHGPNRHVIILGATAGTHQQINHQIPGRGFQEDIVRPGRGRLDTRTRGKGRRSFHRSRDGKPVRINNLDQSARPGPCREFVGIHLQHIGG